MFFHASAAKVGSKADENERQVTSFEKKVWSGHPAGVGEGMGIGSCFFLENTLLIDLINPDFSTGVNNSSTVKDNTDVHNTFLFVFKKSQVAFPGIFQRNSFTLAGLLKCIP